MDYPCALLPVTREPLTLPLGNTVLIPRAYPVFLPWKGAFKRTRITTHKTVLNENGRPCFVEQAILKILEADGWSGLWIGALGRSFQTSTCGEGKLPKHLIVLMNDIYTHAVTRAGCFDVIAWKGEDVLFAEARWKGKELIGRTRLRWLSAALRAGLSPEAFLIVEWELRTIHT